ncbi:MAG TPA: hypothetical protein VFB73_10210 [Chloroflexota bacterium]|nr:hypothetical protein [Chloroflexota bacterium]
MRATDRRALLAVTLGLLLLSYPVVNVLNQPTLVLGIPQLYLYLFGLWLAGIGVAWVLAREES